MLASATRLFWMSETTSELRDTLSSAWELPLDGKRAIRFAVKSICDSARWMPSSDTPNSLIPFLSSGMPMFERIFKESLIRTVVSL